MANISLDDGGWMLSPAAASAAPYRTIATCLGSRPSTGLSSGWTGRTIRRRIFHARYGEHVAQIEIDGLRVLNGYLPPRALRLVREWATLHEQELADNWELAQDLEPSADRAAPLA